jgi:hypothetical protein
LTVWENPPEIPREFFDRLYGKDAGVGHVSAPANIRSAFGVFSHFGGAGIAACCVVVLVGASVRPRTQSKREGAWAFRLWATLSALGYFAGYALVYMEDRYLWPLWGLLLVLALDLVLWVRARISDGQPAADGMRTASRWKPALVWAAGLAFLSFILLHGCPMESDGGWACRLARSLPSDRPVASDDWYMGLYYSFHCGKPFLGKCLGKTPQEVEAELAPFGPCRLVVFYDHELYESLSKRPGFTHVDPPYGEMMLDYRPPPSTRP